MIVVKLIAYALAPLPHMNADRARVAAWAIVIAGGALALWLGRLIWTSIAGAG